MLTQLCQLLLCIVGAIPVLFIEIKIFLFFYNKLK